VVFAAQVVSLRSLVVTRVACGHSHTLVVANATAYSFGRGDSGQLGLGPTVTSALVPTVVLGVSDLSPSLPPSSLTHSLFPFP
jgi:alpha-tubulin suppressor-like RCC1 family protein